MPENLSSEDRDASPLISDFFFDFRNNYLWVSYDGGARSDYLQALRIDSATGELTEVQSKQMPWKNVEGISVDGDDLYLAIDDNRRNSSDAGVYLLKGLISHFLTDSEAGKERHR
ncbi:MAG: hypothetical protein D3906_02755 [Candidatus Electrothrix sp. AUS1_2]|nr:hypothetical protein [Candidatus Electrothrix sp. AUS1_2]